jgi:transposase InsO family protein
MHDSRIVSQHNVDLRQRIVALAQRHKRYGVGMIHLKLRQAGEPVNYKRVERLYQEAKLQVRRRKRKKVPVVEQPPLNVARWQREAAPTQPSLRQPHALRICRLPVILIHA